MWENHPCKCGNIIEKPLNPFCQKCMNKLFPQKNLNDFKIKNHKKSLFDF